MLDPTLEVQTVDNQKSSEIQSSQMVSFISIPHYQLHKLINDSQAFLNKVSKLNNQAKQKIQRSLFKEALIMLNEAQKILQYAAGSGKNIDRDLIVCVLHNLSCTYRNLWIMPKSSTYIQGIIFNLQNQVTSQQSSISSAHINQNSYEKVTSYQIKKSLALYQLKFLATNSQLKQHKISLNAGKKALSNLRQILSENEVYIKKLMKQEYEIVFQNTMKHSMPMDKKQYDALISSRYTLLTEVLAFGENMDTKIYKNLIKAAHFSYQIFNKQKSLGQDHPFATYFRKYSIGDVMQLKPLLFPQKKDTKEKWKVHNRNFEFSSPEESLIFKFILLSISYFSLGTQVRLLLNQQKDMTDSKKQNDQRFKQSEIFHLLAIIIITIMVPFQTLYLKHLLNSYKLHYNSDFFDYKTVENQSVSKIIFLVSGKKYQKYEANQYSENQYHLKERVFDKLSSQKQIHTVRKIKPLYDKSKDNKKSFKTISFLQNKSTVIEKDYPTKGKSKSKSKQKSSQKKSKSKKSKDLTSTVKKDSFKTADLDKKKSPNTKNKRSPANLISTKSRSKSKKKSLSRYEEKYKSGSNSSSNKETYFLSKEIGLSSVLENGSKSKLEKEKQTSKRDSNAVGGISNPGTNLRKIKSGKNLKDFLSTAYGKTTNKSNQSHSISNKKR